MPKRARSNQGQRPKKRQKTKKTKPNTQVVLQPVGVLSPCAKKFAIGLKDAFAVRDPPCMPDLISFPTHKFSTLIRGTFGNSSAGYGYVIARANQPFNDSSQTTQTSTTSVGGGTTTLINFTNRTTTFPTSPYAQLGLDDQQFRMTAMTLRCRYVGTQLNKAGTITAYRHPSNGELDTITVDQIRNVPEAKIFPVTRKWVSVSWQPARTGDFGYNYLPLLNHCLGLIVSGGTAATEEYEFQVRAWYEIHGANITGLSRSDSDTTGMAAVLDKLEGTLAYEGDSHVQQLINSAARGLYDGGSYVAQKAATAAVHTGIALGARALSGWGTRQHQILNNEYMG